MRAGCPGWAKLFDQVYDLSTNDHTRPLPASSASSSPEAVKVNAKASVPASSLGGLTVASPW